MTKTLRKSSLVFLISLFCASCTNKEIFSDFHSFPQGEWNWNDYATFDLHVTDSIGRYDLEVTSRNNNSYPFSNLWLFIDIRTPKDSLLRDTVDLKLADIYGKWLGTGVSTYAVTEAFRTRYCFPDTGHYHVTIRQGMRENPLIGISDVGLTVSKAVEQ